MARATTLKLLALERLYDAECLIANGHVGGAYYIGGYAIELALKAIVCKRLRIEIFDNKEIVRGHIAKAFMIHDLRDLAILAGLNDDLQKACAEDDYFLDCWSRVIKWSEQRRYDMACNVTTARIFVNSLKTVLLWLQLHW
ncbi:hypothetical protein GCM10010967_45460 [Dyadobacter beijingensis]|uniref:HEPN domain-containing protein n=1 Tax=Dyadobacter beijingensis TaxID=365489 RepID=A0ABQ2IBS1_9BACT|nr:hypothetical protein [Dyadobacter beijingensis]GGN05241.1 hypothetical protein GCM10010967_45460 [Dyadobacter beijingensis]